MDMSFILFIATGILSYALAAGLFLYGQRAVPIHSTHEHTSDVSGDENE
ncbi:MAG: hypothetical protein H8K07_02985 [Nitrospira sp.]|nr:hypothetical protein [Nitrospira sp.]